MGNCAANLKHENRERAADVNYAEGEGIGDGVEAHVLMIAIDYAQTPNPLTCTKDARAFKDLCTKSGVTDITKLYDTDASVERVEAEIYNVGGRCNAGDYFIFYYSGHGTEVPDGGADEDDGKDEALVLLDANGQFSSKTLFIDDKLAECISAAVDEEVNIIIICDCCHSGTIADFDSSDVWGNHKAVSLSGCADHQTSGDTGHGGIFTHSMLMAIEEQVKTEGEWSVGQLYNKTLEIDDEQYNSEQDITIGMSQALGHASKMAWPLVPHEGYSARWKKNPNKSKCC